MRQRCAELNENPTPVYLHLCQTFAEMGGVSRREMINSGPEEGEGLGRGEMFPAGATNTVSSNAQSK